MNKIILDVCCGPRMFWFNKKHPNTLYQDIRVEEKGYIPIRPCCEVQPDVVMDFRNMIEDIGKGFAECWRVLDDYGTLIFKWNEESINIKEVLDIFPVKPLFGHPTARSGKTKWCVFMKIPVINEFDNINKKLDEEKNNENFKN